MDDRNRNRRRRRDDRDACDDVLDLRKPESSLLALKRDPEERGTLRVVTRRTPDPTDVDSVTDLLAERILERDAEMRKRHGGGWRDKIPRGVDLSAVVAQRIVEMQQRAQVERYPYEDRAAVVVARRSESKSGGSSEALDRGRDRPPRRRPQRRRDDTPTAPKRPAPRRNVVVGGDSSSTSTSASPSRSPASPSRSPARPRFQLNPNPVGYRKLVKNFAVQVDLPREGRPSSPTQTDLLDRGRHEHVQIAQRPNTTNKRVQARLYTTSTAVTEPVQHEYLYRSKFTNTNSYYDSVDKKVQRREYITEGDLVCIDWINRYLFSASLQPGRYVVDQKVREISEIGTKSTILSDFESW